MGTRADFYVGNNPATMEWIGSMACQLPRHKWRSLSLGVLERACSPFQGTAPETSAMLCAGLLLVFPEAIEYVDLWREPERA